MKKSFKFWGYKSDKLKILFQDISDSLKANGFEKNEKKYMDYQKDEIPQKYKISIEVIRLPKEFKSGDPITTFEELFEAKDQKKSIFVKRLNSRMPAAILCNMLLKTVNDYLERGMRIY